METDRLTHVVREQIGRVGELLQRQDGRWLKPGLAGQGNATTLAWAVVFALANERVPPGAHASVWAPWHRNGHIDVRKSIVKTWRGLDPAHRQHTVREFMLDFSVWTDERQDWLMLTAESEMFAEHAVNVNGDYAWDFSKLLYVPSPHRLFMARAPQRRHQQLMQTLQGLAARARQQGYLRSGDWLGTVVLDEEHSAGTINFTAEAQTF